MNAVKRMKMVVLSLLAVLILLAAVCLWYTRPLTVSALSTPEPARVRLSMERWFEDKDGSLEIEYYDLLLTPEDEEYEAFTSLLDGIRIRRALPFLPVRPVRSQVCMEPGMTTLYWMIRIPEPSFRLEYDSGALTLAYGATGSQPCTLLDQDRTVEVLTAFFLKYGTQDRIGNVLS